MPKAFSNTSPLRYLHQISVLDWLPELFGKIWVPAAVLRELEQGGRRGCHVPNLKDYGWIKLEDPRAMPSKCLALDLGPGELAAMALALENPGQVGLLDDALARPVARAAGLTVWGTLKVLLEAEERGLTERIGPLVDQLGNAGMSLSSDIQEGILVLAGEKGSG